MSLQILLLQQRYQHTKPTSHEMMQQSIKMTNITYETWNLPNNSKVSLKKQHI